MKRRLGLLLMATLACGADDVFAQQGPPPVKVLPDHADGIYKAGEVVTWKVECSGDVPATATYVVKRGGQTDAEHGELKFDGKTATFTSKFDDANTALAVVTIGEKKYFGGAVADPYAIKPAAEEPADFDAFWKGKLAELDRIAPNAQLTSGESPLPNVQYFKVTLDNINGTKVQGQLARPTSGEKFPAVLVPQWAGVYALQKPWATDRAKDGWLCLNIEAHDIPIDNPPDFYTKLYGKGGGLENYWKIDNTDKDKSYYVRMYLGVVQSIRYLKTRPDWDGKTIVIMGGSQGGQQSIVGAALCADDIDACMAMFPAACDNWAENIGRHSGFPFWWQQVDGRDANAVRETSKYFDPVYFAKRVKCPTLTAAGLRDELAPPSSVLAMFNGLGGPKQILIMPDTGHYNDNGMHGKYWTLEYGQWLTPLKSGQAPNVQK